MKQYAALFFVLLLFSACQKTTNPEGIIVASFSLTEVLLDPGDGSGTFYPVSSDKTISFYSDGQVKSNGDLCLMEGPTGTSTTGEYSLNDKTITTDCGTIYFVKTGNELILQYPCIEPCSAKYIEN